jgi:hypothetical protein
VKKVQSLTPLLSYPILSFPVLSFHYSLPSILTLYSSPFPLTILYPPCLDSVIALMVVQYFLLYSSVLDTVSCYAHASWLMLPAAPPATLMTFLPSVLAPSSFPPSFHSPLSTVNFAPKYTTPLLPSLNPISPPPPLLYFDRN